MTHEHLMLSNPTPSKLHLRHNDERRHADGSHSALALRLYLATCNPSSRCQFWVLDHLCFNWSQSFHSCCITETRSLNLSVYIIFSSSAFASLIQINFRYKPQIAIWTLSPQRFHYYFCLLIVSWQSQKYWTILILVLCLLCVKPVKKTTSQNLWPRINSN